MENQFYQMYLDELSEIPECTNEEMEALLNSLPNEEAVKRLTEGSLAYVVREAAKYAGNDVEISDLVQEGNMTPLPEQPPTTLPRSATTTTTRID